MSGTSPRVQRHPVLALAILVSLAVGTATGAAPRRLVDLPVVRWRHTLAWTVSSDEVLFGQITDLVRLRDGAVAAADVQLGQVLVIAAGGTPVQTLAVSGDGPGQVRQLTSLAETATGDLLLVQAWPGRVEAIARDGTPLRSLRPLAKDRQVPVLLRVAPARDLWLGLTVFVRAESPRTERTVLELAWLDPRDLSPIGAVLRRETATEIRPAHVDETASYAPRRAWAILPDGRAVVAPDRDAYRLEVHAPLVGTVAALVRDHTPLPRPDAEAALIRRAFRLEVDGRPRPIEFTLFATAEAIQTIVALDERRLVVGSARTFHALPAGASARCDLVDLAAATVREVLVGVPCVPWRDALVVLDNRDAVVVRHGFGGLAAAGFGPLPGEDPAGAPVIEYWTYEEETP